MKKNMVQSLLNLIKGKKQNILPLAPVRIVISKPVKGISKWGRLALVVILSAFLRFYIIK